ncbi:MAG: hypothetical protein P9M11_03170 [Candidatus Tenebribacter burtonii]|jgi:hypothetical protein|nr:hypothetical protein [Candidatus Tenebribacter burtonii]
MIIILAIISIILISFFYKKTIPVINNWQKILLISLRSIAIIILFLLLLNPILYFFHDKAVRPSVVILNDVSESMQQFGKKQTKSEIFKDFNNKIETIIGSKDYNIINFDFANGINGNKTSTNLSKTFLQVFKKIDSNNIEAIFLLSDGWFNDEEFEMIGNQNIPVYAIDPHFQSDDFDIKLTDIKHNKSVYRNEITPIEATITVGNYEGKAKIELYTNDLLINEKVVDLNGIDFLQINFDTSFQSTGFTPISLKITTDSTETNTENNLLSSAIQVKRDHSKVLLISDILNWDVKFIISAVNHNQHWQSKFLLKKNQLQFGNKSTRFETEMDNINVLTLINYGNLNFSENEVILIDRFVRNGGGLFIVGKPIIELEDISPAISSGINRIFKSTFALTKLSEQFSTFSSVEKKELKNIPPVSYYYVNSKIEAKVLAQFNNDERSPAILFKNIVNGKILHFAFLDLWKWQLWNSNNRYNNLMHNIFSWLGQTSSDRFYASLDKNSFYLGEDININLLAFDETLSPITEMNAEISVTNSESEIVYQSFFLKENNKHSIKISDLQSGKYNFVISDKISNLQTEGEFIISQNSPESRDNGINLSLLSYISNKTNGKFIENMSDLEISKAKKEIIKLKFEIPIYKKWYLIALFLFVFCMELFFRKRWGLL